MDSKKAKTFIIMDDCLAEKGLFTKTGTILDHLITFSFYNQQNNECQKEKEQIEQLCRMEEVD